MTNWKRAKSLIGGTFGALKVVSLHGRMTNKMTLWNAVCVCGRQVVRRRDALVSGRAVSCGCVSRRELVAVPRKEKKPSNYTRPEYAVWSSMKQRCSPRSGTPWPGDQGLREVGEQF